MVLKKIYLKWATACVAHFFCSLFLLTLFLVFGKGLIDSLPFKGIHGVFFLIRLIPTLLLYTIPVASWYVTSFHAFFVERDGVFFWFEAFFSLQRSLWVYRIFLIVFLLIFYFFYASIGYQWLDSKMNQWYLQQGMKHFLALQPQKWYEAGNCFFRVEGSNKGFLSDFFFNIYSLPFWDLIAYAKEFCIKQEVLQLDQFQAVLEHQGVGTISMKVKKAFVDVPFETLFALKKSQSIDLWTANLYTFLLLLSGFWQGKKIAKKDFSIVALIALGLVWLLITYVLLKSFH